MSKLQVVTEYLDGYKTIIGLLLDWLVTHVLPSGTWYTDLLAILAYALIFGGGVHKAVKLRIKYLENKYGS